LISQTTGQIHVPGTKTYAVNLRTSLLAPPPDGLVLGPGGTFATAPEAPVVAVVPPIGVVPVTTARAGTASAAPRSGPKGLEGPEITAVELSVSGARRLYTFVDHKPMTDDPHLNQGWTDLLVTVERPDAGQTTPR
jgi:hypothetical protein